jgi:hypothetical protein
MEVIDQLFHRFERRKRGHGFSHQHAFPFIGMTAILAGSLKASGGWRDTGVFLQSAIKMQLHVASLNSSKINSHSTAGFGQSRREHCQAATFFHVPLNRRISLA